MTLYKPNTNSNFKIKIDTKKDKKEIKVKYIVLSFKWIKYVRNKVK